jgi:general secretion pathway protein J
MSARSSRGFTLVELAVAILIVAIIAAIGYGTINQAIKSREMLKDQQTQLLGLQNAVRLMEQDFVALTRAGWANPAGLQRTGLQRVAYFLENGTLRREYWNVLDPTLASTTIKHDLLTHVKSFTLRYLDVNHNWQPQWPPSTNCQGCATQEQALRQRPLAVEITVDTEEWGKIVRIIEIAA